MVALAGLSLPLFAGPPALQLSGSSQPTVGTVQEPSDYRYHFEEIAHGQSPNHEVAEDHEVQVLLRWGDPLLPGAPIFDPFHQSPEAQEQQFGYNNDFVGYVELEPGTGQQGRALLCVNHEYPSSHMMFPGLPATMIRNINARQVEIEKAAVGVSVVEIEKVEGNWRFIQESPYNRRISSRSAIIHMSGPAAGHQRLRTSADPDGTRVIGTLNNCAGGITPWGTFLTCEENFDYHFGGNLSAGHSESHNHRRYSVPGEYFPWSNHDQRFDIGKEPREPNRFGWVVEIDPLNPTAPPKKRTALGRFKHEGAENVMAPDGRLVVYMGDDQRYDYLYKFISENKVNLGNRSANTDLLDQGILYSARLLDNGDLHWLPLIYDRGPLTEKNGFQSQADVLIEARRAADLLGATPMDRPEDLTVDANTGCIYVMLTNNRQRTAEQLDAANPRSKNLFGHIIEIQEPEGNFASKYSRWNILIKAGDPKKADIDALWHEGTSEQGWFASPDNGTIDSKGRLWVTTDQGEKRKLTGTNDGMWALETQGRYRGLGRMFFRCPQGAEACGPAFSKDGESLFLAIQHPGGDNPDNDFGNPSTRWPDFNENMPPRPAIVVIQRKGGGQVG